MEQVVSEDFVALVEKYSGSLTHEYVGKVSEAAKALKKKYQEAIENEGLAFFFKELPNFNDLRAGLMYQLAASEDSEINVSKHLEEGNLDFAELFLQNYLESATKEGTRPDLELMMEKSLLNSVRKFRDERHYDVWKKHLEQSGNDSGVLDMVAGVAENYLKGAAAVLGGGEQELKVIEYLATAGKKVSVQMRLGELIAQGEGEEAEKEVFRYFNAAVKVFGEREGFEELNAMTEDIEKKRHELKEKEAEGKLTDEDFDDFTSDILDLKKRVDNYGDIEEYKEALAATVEGVRSGLDDEAYNKGLVSFEARISRHLEEKGIEERCKKAIELIGKTEPYLRRSYNPEEIDIDSINFGFLAAKADKRALKVLDVMYEQLKAEYKFKRSSEEQPEELKAQGTEIREFAERLVLYAVPEYLRQRELVTIENPAFLKSLINKLEHDVPYQMEMTYAAIAHSDAKRFGRFNELTQRVAKEVKKRDGEDPASVVLSEISDVFGSAYPVEDYFEEFPYAPLVPPENLETGNTDIAKILGVDAAEVDRKAREARAANSGRFRKFLRGAGRMFGFGS